MANQNFNSLFNTPDYTQSFHPEDIKKNKVMAILSYLGIFVLIPIFAAPQSPYSKFHANQGLVLFIAEVAINLVCGLMRLVPVVGVVFNIIQYVLGVPVYVLAIVGLVYACTDKAKVLPLIGKIRILK